MKHLKSLMALSEMFIHSQLQVSPNLLEVKGFVVELGFDDFGGFQSSTKNII